MLREGQLEFRRNVRDRLDLHLEALSDGCPWVNAKRDRGFHRSCPLVGGQARGHSVGGGLERRDTVRDGRAIARMRQGPSRLNGYGVTVYVEFIHPLGIYVLFVGRFH